METNGWTAFQRVVLPWFNISMTSAQAIILLFLLGFGLLLYGLTVSIALANTILIFLFITMMGLWLCHRTRVVLGDSKLNILGTFWLLKVFITIVLLYVGWIPMLDPSSASWGYDPQRYFQDAWNLIENGWNPIAGSNYQGIIFYYGAIFYAFGHNPIIPALVNAFVTLIGTLYLIKYAYEFSAWRSEKDWTIAGLLLVPEVLWYDVMTSRETLMAVLIIIAPLAISRYLFRINNCNLVYTLLLSGFALIVILVVRTSMAFPVLASIVITATLLNPRRKINLALKVLLVALAISTLLAGPLIQQVTGGYDINYLATLDRIQSFESNVASQMEWSENSIGLLLAPNNALQSLLYLPPRMLLYLTAPLPNLAISLSGLFNGLWSAWQHLMAISTSVMILLGFPSVLAGTAQAWRFRRRQPASLVLHITFWVTFIAVAGGNIIIQERYRLMFTLLLFACMWFGYTHCSHIKIMRWAYPWFFLLASGAIFCMGYKIMA